MAADAIARQYDVDKNRVVLTCEGDKGGYRPGTITFYSKNGKSVDLRKMEESLRATRLSGGTAMSVDALEITATGAVVLDAGALVLKVSGTSDVFVLKEASTKDGAKTALVRLREAVASGAKVGSVTGNVEGWNGRFPAVLATLAKQPADAQMVLLVTAFELK
jgi:hypothetical protein